MVAFFEIPYGISNLFNHANTFMTGTAPGGFLNSAFAFPSNGDPVIIAVMIDF